MNPVPFKSMNSEVAKDQPEYLTLPAYQDSEITVSCWKMSWTERLTIFLTGVIWITQMNWRTPLQPIRPSVAPPEGLP